MPCSTSIQGIDPSEYIGNSLATINNNFSILQEGVNINCSSMLSATDVLGTLRNVVTTLQGYAEGRPKAWVVFDGTRDVNANINSAPGNRFINTKFNIDSVYKESTGVYNVYFADSLTFVDPPPGELPAYSALVTSSTTQIVGGKYTWAQPLQYEVDRLTIEVTDGQGVPNYADPSRITVAIF